MLKCKNKKLILIYGSPIGLAMLLATVFTVHTVAWQPTAKLTATTLHTANHAAATSSVTSKVKSSTTSATHTSAVSTPSTSKSTAAVGVVSKAPTSNTSPFYVPLAASQVISTAAQTASSSDATILSRLAAQPTATWFGDWSGDIRTSVDAAVTAAVSNGKTPLLVAYNIPNRDCGGQSSGGAADAQSYANWISAFAAGIRNRPAWIILEPDAVASDCFDTARANMLASAVLTLRATGARVYVDAGNPTWRSVSEIVNRLNQAGIANATGFSLNVSNFQTTASNISYGTQVSSLIGGKHFVIDTSRNGNGGQSASDWCNPAGQALGIAPTTTTGSTLADAYLWIKIPGESDGTCGPSINGSVAPSAGTFWAQYALELARNAGW